MLPATVQIEVLPGPENTSSEDGELIKDIEAVWVGQNGYYGELDTFGDTSCDNGVLSFEGHLWLANIPTDEFGKGIARIGPIDMTISNEGVSGSWVSDSHASDSYGIVGQGTFSPSTTGPTGTETIAGTGTSTGTGTGTGQGCAWMGNCSSTAPEGAYDCGLDETIYQCINGEWVAVVDCATMFDDGYPCQCEAGCGITGGKCRHGAEICQTLR